MEARQRRARAITPCVRTRVAAPTLVGGSLVVLVAIATVAVAWLLWTRAEDRKHVEDDRAAQTANEALQNSLGRVVTSLRASAGLVDAQGAVDDASFGAYARAVGSIGATDALALAEIVTSCPAGAVRGDARQAHLRAGAARCVPIRRRAGRVRPDRRDLAGRRCEERPGRVRPDERAGPPVDARPGPLDARDGLHRPDLVRHRRPRLPGASADLRADRESRGSRRLRQRLVQHARDLQPCSSACRPSSGFASASTGRRRTRRTHHPRAGAPGRSRSEAAGGSSPRAGPLRRTPRRSRSSWEGRSSRSCSVRSRCRAPRPSGA